MTPDEDLSRTDGDAYRTMLLSLAGEDDPADVQAATLGALRELLAEAGGDLRRRPAQGEWSVLELLGHLTDAELVMAARYRWALAHDEPELLGYDQDLWVVRLRHNDAEPEELLALFEALRFANIALWRRTPEAERPRAGRHLERGRESYEVMFRMIAGHDRFHTDQTRRTIDAVRAAVSAGSAGPGLESLA